MIRVYIKLIFSMDSLYHQNGLFEQIGKLSWVNNPKFSPIMLMYLAIFQPCTTPVAEQFIVLVAEDTRE